MWLGDKAIKVSLISVVLIAASQGSYDPTDRVTKLPSYGRQELKHGVTGTVLVHVSFAGGRVQSARVTKTELTAKDRYLEVYPDLIDVWLKRVEAQTKELQSGTISPFEADIKLEFRQEIGLSENARKYALEFGADGIPLRIEIKGP